MTNNKTIRAEFERLWFTGKFIQFVGGSETADRAKAWQGFYRGWKACEARQEHKDSAGALRIVPAASP
jgi:hypothetical protein